MNLNLTGAAKRRRRQKCAQIRVKSVDAKRRPVQVPGQKSFVLKMVCGSIADLREHNGGRLERIPSFEIDDASATLAGQFGRRDEVDSAEQRPTAERVIDPFV